MSALNELFGSVKAKNVTSTVAALFSKSNEVDVNKVKAKSRTVLPEIVKLSATVESSEEKDKEHEKDEAESQPKRKKKKTKKSEAGDDDNDNLETQYYSKVLGTAETKATAEDDSGADSDEATEAEPAKVNAVGGATAKVIDLKEQELVKAEKTIFIGNVPNEVITSKKLYKDFKRLVSTDPRTSEEAESENDKLVNFKVDSIRFRSIAFDEALPRKVAFVHQKLHKSRDSINAYVVYEEVKPVNIMCQFLNGKVFQDHHLRIDSVTHPAPHDKRRSVFVGNLDFEEVEENLWKHFSSCGDIEYVRIIRDSKTNMGKGFAYVQFQDFQSVNKALLLHEKKMGEGKKSRKLRVSRCKNMRKGQPQQQQSLLPDRRLNEQQKTKYGRAKKVLGKADRATLGEELTIEGLRASKGDTVTALKKTKNRSKTGRVTKRSQAFKKQNPQ